MPFQQHTSTPSFTPVIDNRSGVYYQTQDPPSIVFVQPPSSESTHAFTSPSTSTSTSASTNHNDDVHSHHSNTTKHTYVLPSSTHPTNSNTDISVNPSLPMFNNDFGCRSVLAAHRSKGLSNSDYFKVLYCMYTGCEGTSVRNRIGRLIDNKSSTMTIRTVKPLKKQYATELMRRYSYLMIRERGVSVNGSNKLQFRPNNKTQEEINSFLNSPIFSLPSSEKLHIEFEMESFLSQHETQLKITLELQQQQGSEILRSDLRRMRLWEAIFLDSKYMRNKLVTLKTTLTRQQIDARTSQTAPRSLFELAAEKYNDPNWVVYSRVLPDLNEKFRTPIKLTLMSDEERMTEQSVKQAYTDAKGKMNIALANWKRSGNGSGNKNYKLKGLDYDEKLAQSDENTSVTYVDDDRYSFVNHLHIAYFWSLSEICGLTHHISQNCSALTDTFLNSSCSSLTKGRSINQEASVPKKQQMEQQTEALLAMVSDIKKGFVKQSHRLNQATLNSQLLEAEEGLVNL
jgi:hypothetical protein